MWRKCNWQELPVRGYYIITQVGEELINRVRIPVRKYKCTGTREQVFQEVRIRYNNSPVEAYTSLTQVRDKLISSGSVVVEAGTFRQYKQSEHDKTLAALDLSISLIQRRYKWQLAKAVYVSE